MSNPYSFYSVPLCNIVSLSILKPFFNGNIDIYAEVDKATNRQAQEGLWLFVKDDIAIAYSDFRVSGGSFGCSNSKRMQAFLTECTQRKLPLIFIINSMGVSFFHGRKVFNDAFALLPALLNFKKVSTLYTVALKHAFGLSAVMFALGHYRIAIEQQSVISLAGPLVEKLFFGRQASSTGIAASHRVNGDLLVHELCFSFSHAIDKVLSMIKFLAHTSIDKRHYSLSIAQVFCATQQAKMLVKAGQFSLNFLAHIADDGIELFVNADVRVKIFVITLNTKKVGVMMNPLGFYDNALTANTLSVYIEAMLFFKALQLPVISIVDTPGIDPLLGSGNVIEKMAQLSELIIDYPYKKIGVIAGRSYGGATVLAMPKIFGGYANLALEGADLGVMQAAVIDKLLRSSVELSAHWQQSQENKSQHFSDLLADKSLDEIVSMNNIKSRLDYYLSSEL